MSKQLYKYIYRGKFSFMLVYLHLLFHSIFQNEKFQQLSTQTKYASFYRIDKIYTYICL